MVKDYNKSPYKKLDDLLEEAIASTNEKYNGKEKCILPLTERVIIKESHQ